MATHSLLTIASIFAIIFLANSTQSPPPTGTDRVSHFLDKICLKLGLKWSTQWHASTSQHEEGTVVVTEAEFHVLLTVLEVFDETDFNAILAATEGQITDRRGEGNERGVGMDLPMLFAVFRFVLEQYEIAQKDGDDFLMSESKQSSTILSQWLIDALELVRPVNEFMLAQSTEQNANRVIPYRFILEDNFY